MSMYVDKLEVYPVERRAYVIYRKDTDMIWPKGHAKYELLLLKMITLDVDEWTFGRGTQNERSVIVEW